MHAPSPPFNRNTLDQPANNQPAQSRPVQQTPAIEARGLTRRFGPVKALTDFSLTLAPGQALGLIGTNGAGKTTALKLLQGIRKPDAGQGRIFGHPIGSIAARAQTGITPQNADFPEQMTPREVLAYAAAHFERPKPVGELIAAFDLGKLIDRRMDGFSGGESRRVALALAFVGNPRLVFADEPTSGLDTDGQEMFRAYARAYADAGGSLLLTSHHWDEIEHVCDRIVMIDQGRQIIDGTLDDIGARAGRNRVSFVLADGALLPPWADRRLQARDGRLEAIVTDSDALVRRLIEQMPEAVLDLQVAPLDLKQTVAQLRKEAIQ